MGIYGSPDLGTGKNSEARFYKCKKCGHEYIKEWEHCPKCRTPKGKGGVRPIFWCFLFIAIIAFIINFFDSPIIPDTELTDSRVTEPFTEDPVPPPATGIYQLFTSNELLAPFEIKNHTDNNDYLLKFIDVNTNSPVLTIFLNKNENCKVNVPLGTYEIIYASGDIWYGDKELFGTNTLFQKYENTYDFYLDSSGYRGYYIDMAPQIDGNLKSSYITEDQFN